MIEKELQVYLNNVFEHFEYNTIIKDQKVLGDKKVIFYLIGNNYAADFSILDNYIYDFMLIKVENDELIDTHTIKFNDIKKLISQINVDLNNFNMYENLNLRI